MDPSSIADFFCSEFFSVSMIEDLYLFFIVCAVVFCYYELMNSLVMELGNTLAVKYSFCILYTVSKCAIRKLATNFQFCHCAQGSAVS